MFANLIESASHQQDLARKGRFFLATLISYAVIVTCAGLASIYAYDTHVENQDLEFLGLVPPIVPEAPSAPKSTGPKSKSTSNPKNTLPQRTVPIERIDSGTKVPNGVSAIKSDIPEVPLGRYIIGPSNIDTDIGGPIGDTSDGGSGGGGPLVKVETPPRPETPATPEPPKIMRRSSLLNGDAILLPKPVYPRIALTARAMGPVNVNVMIDETGKISSARATSGNPLLLNAAVQAAYQAKFRPTVLNGVPVKVSGVIIYNFILP